MAITKPVNMKLPDVTKEQIAEIKGATLSTTNTAVVVAAVDLLYRHIVVGENIGQSVVLVVGNDAISNLPISDDSMRSIMDTVGIASVV